MGQQRNNFHRRQVGKALVGEDERRHRSPMTAGCSKSLSHKLSIFALPISRGQSRFMNLAPERLIFFRRGSRFAVKLDQSPFQ
jgi:hypothetical protein